MATMKTARTSLGGSSPTRQLDKETTENGRFNDRPRPQTSSTVAQLKVACRANNLAVSGKKSDLRERLKQHCEDACMDVHTRLFPSLGVPFFLFFIFIFPSALHFHFLPTLFQINVCA
jgi:hypothetical protein